MYFVFFIASLLFTSAVALAQEVSPIPSPSVAPQIAAVVAPSQPFLAEIVQFFMNGANLAKIMAFVIALQIFLRGLAEALTRISNYTDNKWDNKAAAYASQAAWLLGVFIGKIGYGVPRLVVDEMKKPEDQPKVA